MRNWVQRTCVVALLFLLGLAASRAEPWSRPSTKSWPDAGAPRADSHPCVAEPRRLADIIRQRRDSMSVISQQRPYRCSALTDLYRATKDYEEFVVGNTQACQFQNDVSARATSLSRSLFEIGKKQCGVTWPEDIGPRPAPLPPKIKLSSGSLDVS